MRWFCFFAVARLFFFEQKVRDVVGGPRGKPFLFDKPRDVFLLCVK